MKEFEIQFGFSLQNQMLFDSIDERILPYRKAPVLVQQASGYAMSLMNFSLVPSWSKDPKVKFATHNARIETVLEKPTWKKPFLSQRVLVPLTYFVEPIYENDMAGHMVQFHPRDGKLLFAAGIYDEWLHKETGEVLSSFSILTQEPPEFIAQVGHDRCPIFLKKEAFTPWLESGKKEGSALLQLLKENTAAVDFAARIDRAMRPGWEKRK